MCIRDVTARPKVGSKPVWETGWLLWWPVSAVILCWGEYVTCLSSAHTLPLVSSSDLLTLIEPALAVGQQEGISVSQCTPGAVWKTWNRELTTVLSLGAHAAFLTRLNTRNLFDPKVTDRNYEPWYFQPSKIGKQNLRKIWIYSPAHGCSTHCWPCSFKAGDTGVW